MKLAFVTPRYGVEVVGGAEYAARMLAERVVSGLDWDVEVFTSAALDASTWANHYRAETLDINSVVVHRFPTVAPRSPRFLETSRVVHASPRLAPLELQERWIDEQGPTTPELIDALAASDADAFAFYPYLYYPTVRGVPVVGRRAIMHPAAHDEPALRMPVFGPVFARTRGFVFHTEGERRLVERVFPVADRPQIMLGLGVEPLAGDVAGFRRQFDLGDAPYVLCVGRVDDGKGARMLAAYFSAYKARHPGPLKLVFVGPVIRPLDPDPDIVVTGLVSDEHKWGALEGAELLVSPSPFESFSLVLLEAWLARRPVMVNARCVATREHVERSGGGLWFDGYATFEAGLHRLLYDRTTAQELASAGERYVETHFRWPSLIERYGHFVEQVAERAQARKSFAGDAP